MTDPRDNFGFHMSLLPLLSCVVGCRSPSVHRVGTKTLCSTMYSTREVDSSTSEESDQLCSLNRLNHAASSPTPPSPFAVPPYSQRHAVELQNFPVERTVTMGLVVFGSSLAVSRRSQRRKARYAEIDWLLSNEQPGVR